jgi:hypothetical protein
MRVRRAVLIAALTIGGFEALDRARINGHTAARGSETRPTQRTAGGHPDLQGIWTIFGMAVPSVERPPRFSGREFLNETELAQAERLERESFAKALREANGPRAASEIDGALVHEQGIVGAEYNNFWIERPARPRRVWPRTSLVIDPPDGRIPPLTLTALQRLEARERARASRGIADSWEDRNLNERCITSITSGLNEQLDSNHAAAARHILQTPTEVAITSEMTGFYESRIIPVDGRPHVSDQIRLWLGDARGYWKGDWLVIETMNINDRQDGGPIMPSRRPFVFYMGSGATLHLIERYRRIDADTLEYQYTVDDPETYVRPYTIAFPLTRDDHYRMFEVGCHEGNYGLTNILAAGRADDRGALDTALIEAEARRPRLNEMRRRTEASQKK